MTTQSPDILSSATFWAQIATMWAAAGAWFTYVAAAMSWRKQTYEGTLNLILGLEAELDLVSEWASGAEGDQGYLNKSRDVLTNEHPDWFNPSRAIFKFATPTLNNLTNSAYASNLAPIVRPLVMLNHSIRRLFDNIDRYQIFVFADTSLYKSVLKKLSPAITPLNRPVQIITPKISQAGLTSEEMVYVNHIFGMNETIHQGLIGGADSQDQICLYKAFRAARTAVQEFKTSLKPEPLPLWFLFLHITAALIAGLGFWEVMRWLDVW